MEWVIINLIQDLLDNQLTCCVTRRGSRCKKVASNKVIVHDTVLGFCKLKTCQKELLGSYTKRQIKKYKKINRAKTLEFLDSIAIKKMSIRQASIKFDINYSNRSNCCNLWCLSFFKTFR